MIEMGQVEKPSNFIQPDPNTIPTSISLSDLGQSNNTNNSNKNQTWNKRYIKPLASLNDIHFVVIDKDILEKLGLKNSTSIILEQEITYDRKGILLRIQEPETK